MTDSIGTKRERLIAAARQTVYEQGIEKTTLADIAAAAGIPLGNVYYYFKTKNDLVQAVVEAHLNEARGMLAAVEVIARYQGTALLASTLRDPGLLARESARVAAWLDTIGG